MIDLLANLPDPQSWAECWYGPGQLAIFRAIGKHGSRTAQEIAARTGFARPSGRLNEKGRILLRELYTNDALIKTGRRYSWCQELRDLPKK